MSNSEPGIIREFRELYDYVRLMGEHINQIHMRLDKIERNISEVSASHRSSIMANRSEITNIEENMVNKYEFNDFVEQLKASIGEILPPLPMLAKQETPAEELQRDTDED